MKSARFGGGGRALPAETKVESGTSQSKSGTSVNLSNSGNRLSFPGTALQQQPSVLTDAGATHPERGSQFKNNYFAEM